MANLSAQMRKEFKESVTVRQMSTQSGYGIEDHDAGIAYDARHVQRTVSVYSMDGERIMASGVVWIAPDENGVLPTVVPGQTVITLPNGDEPRVVAIDIYDNSVELDHVKVWYGYI